MLLTMLLSLALTSCGSREEPMAVILPAPIATSSVVEKTEAPVAIKLPEATIESVATPTPEILITPTLVVTEPPVIEDTPSPEPIITEQSATEPPPTESSVPEFDQWDMLYVDDDTDMADDYERYKTFYADEAISYDAEDKPVLNLEECRAMSLARFEEVYAKYGNILDQFLMRKYYAEIPSDLGKAYLENMYGALSEDNQFSYTEGQKDYAQAYWEIMYMLETEELQHIYAEKLGLTYWDCGYFSGNDGGPTLDYIPIYGCELKDDWDYLLALCNGDEDSALFLSTGVFYGFSTVEEYDCYVRRLGISWHGEYEWIYMELKANGSLDWDRYVVH